MGARTKARKRALDMLYVADVRQVPLQEVLDEETRRAAAQPQRASSWPYAEEIVRGVIEHAHELDAELESRAVGWSLARMPVVDRAVLRLAAWELRHNAEVPTPVVIAEALEFAAVLSTEESASFVNGVLGAVAEAARP
jgi:N utilization substance protein B